MHEYNPTETEKVDPGNPPEQPSTTSTPPEPPPPSTRRGCGCLLFLISFCLVIAAGLGIAYWHIQSWSRQPYGAPGEHTLKILPRTPARGIARMLERDGLISDDLRLLAWLRLQSPRPNLQAGEYKIKTPVSPRELVDALRRGAFERTLTIPEGWTARQIAARLVKERWIAQEWQWLDLVARPMEAAAGVFSKNGAEGYLFPETYRIDAAAKPEDILRRMLERFRVEWERLDPTRRDPRSANLTTTQVVVLASMIEREARSTEEMPRIASVYLNRLQKRMKLQCCATVRFAMGGVWDRPLLNSDLKTSSPYNTYLHAGLPPGPIANPGRAALAAVLRPAATDYLYYVWSGNDHHVFSRTFSEHMKAVRAARKINPAAIIGSQD